MFLNKYLQSAFMWVFHDIYTNAYTGEITADQRSGMTKAKLSDFAANNYTYYYTEGIGPDNSNAATVAAGAKLYIIRSRTVNPNFLVQEAREFAEFVRSGNAFASNVPGSTTTTTAGLLASKSKDAPKEADKAKETSNSK